MHNKASPEQIQKNVKKTLALKKKAIKSKPTEWSDAHVADDGHRYWSLEVGQGTKLPDLNRGFTLIELLICIAIGIIITGVLGALAFVAWFAFHYTTTALG